jgi:hypothetical protein
MSTSVVFSVRIPRRLKEEMEELKDLVDLSIPLNGF